MKVRIQSYCIIVLLIFSMAVPMAATAKNQMVNLNTATVEELASLKGIGEKYAQRIINYRKKNGPFKKTEDITNVKGIGHKTWEKNKGFITVSKGKTKG